MREILFRGKHVDNREWIYGSYTHVHDTCGNISIIPTGKNVFISVISETVGQYTGLKDNNEKKIFEGDIIKDVSNGKGYSDEELEKMGIPKEHYNRVGKNHIFQIGVVVCRKGGFFIESVKGESKTWCSLNFSIENEFSYCTVIGNMYDNPELLSSSIN